MVQALIQPEKEPGNPKCDGCVTVFASKRSFRVPLVGLMIALDEIFALSRKLRDVCVSLTNRVLEVAVVGDVVTGESSYRMP